MESAWWKNIRIGVTVNEEVSRLDLNIYLVSNFRTRYIHYKLEIRLAVPHVGYFVIWSGVFYTLL